jgi:uncharacterized LabA/DUF88 family protein
LDRCALFVDANYALAEGALVVHGTRNRDSVSWDYASLLKLLCSLSRDRTGLPLLRCYWYDTAADGARAADHETLADIPGVKLRLSKARPSRKEGVEAEIRKDLTALARNHAVSDVIIVSAEEDLAPVIAEVQDLGIRTVLFHVATEAGWAISRTLRQECDDIIEIGAGHLRPYVDLISGAEPQLPAAGFRELAGTAAQSSGPHPAIEAPSAGLYGSAMAADYEHAALASAGASQLQGHRQDASRFGGPGETSQGQPIAHAQTAQTPMNQAARAQMAQSQMAQSQMAQSQMAHGQTPDGQMAQGPAAQPSIGQSSRVQSPGYPAPNQQSPGLQSPGPQPAGQQPADQQPAGQQDHGQQIPGQAAQAQQYQRSDLRRGQQPASAEAGFDPAGFGGQDNRGLLGQPSHLASIGNDQRGGPDDGRGRHGSLGQPGSEALNGAGETGPGQNGLGHIQPGQPQFGQSQFGSAQFGQSQFGQQPGQSQFGQQPGQNQAGQAQPGYFGQVAAGPASNGAGGHQPSGFGAQGAGHPGGTGSQPHGQPGNGLPPGGLPANGLPANGLPTGQGGPAASQRNGMQAGGYQSQGPPPNGAPPNAMPAGGLAANGGPANGLSSGPGRTPGPTARGGAAQSPGAGLGGTQHQDSSLGQPGYGQPRVGQAGAGTGERPGSHAAAAMPSAPVPPNGVVPPDGQRAPLPQRQLPSGNGVPYAQDRSMPYGGSGQPAQFSGPAATGGYGQNAYGGQQSPVAPVGVSVGDAVQSAHAEGFGFGEAVARDAPALWLEAVLARKPRMPSDLEARLLQGSALPIDSLLHDEVRHALRRGFWDALERSRR